MLFVHDHPVLFLEHNHHHHNNNNKLKTSVWEKAAPPALSLKPANSVSPHTSLVPFVLLPQRWSLEQVSPKEHVSRTRNTSWLSPGHATQW